MDDIFIHHFYLRIGDVEYTITPLGILLGVGVLVCMMVVAFVIVRLSFR